MRSAAFDLRAADDRLDAVVAEDDPGLVAAVVVGRPELQRRRPAPDRDLLVAGLLLAAPNSHERVALALRPDRRRLAMAGMDDGLRRQLEQPHDRGLEVVEAARARRHRAADRALEEDVGG